MRWLFFWLLASVAAAAEPIWLEGNAMEMPWRLCIEREKESVKELIETTFREIEMTFSLYNANSELSRLNRAPTKKRLTLSPSLAEVLHLAMRIHALSEGRFDPACGAIKQAWIASFEKKCSLSPAAIDKLKERSGAHLIRLDKDSMIKQADVVIDLDGLAKGYAIDKVIERLLARGHKNCFFEWSGDIRAAGSHPSGRPWQVAIPGEGHRLMPLDNCAIAGSGDYLQNWRGFGIEEKKLFTHFASPKTGRLLTARRLAGATVVASSCVLADALATSAMLCESLEEFNHWTTKVKKEIKGLHFWPLLRGNHE